MFRHKLYLWLFVFWLMVCILKWRYSSKIISNILIINFSFKIYLNFWALMQGLLYRWTEPSVDFFWKNDHWVREKGPPNYTPGWSFWNMIFYNLKKFTSRSIQWGVKLYFEYTRCWSLSCSNTVISWQKSWNDRFWPLTTISE